MKRISSMITALLLCFFMGAKADNVVTVSSTEGAPGDEVTVSIGLENSDAVSSLQVSIPLDESLTLVAGSGQLGSRCSSHSLTIGVKDGVLNVFVYSMSMATISGTSGEVASFKLKLGNQPAMVVLTPSETLLAGSTGQTVTSSAVSGEVTTRCAKAQYSTMEVDFGAVPIHGTYTQTVTVTNVGNDDLTVTDLMFSDVNVFSSTTGLPFTLTPSSSQEVNITYNPVERGSITRTLKVECNSVSKLNTIKLLAQPFAVNELHIQDASGISDEEVTIHMVMNNMDPISGYQVEFDLPEQFEYVANSFTLSDRKVDHTPIATLTGNKLCIIVYSGTDKPLAGNDGEIGSFKLKLVGRNGTTLTPTNTVLSATINNHVENVVSAVYGGQVDILSPQISCNDQLDFGAVAVTEACEQTFTIRNNGSAPLTVSRIVFNNEALSIKESLPLVIAAGNSQEVTVVYDSVEQTAFDATMQIYSNDPDLRLKEVSVSGSRFAPNYMAVATPVATPTGNLRILLSVDNYDPIIGLQFDVEYPAEYEPFDNNYSIAARAAGMTVNALSVGSHTLRYFCYFLSGNSLATGKGQVMSIELKPVGEHTPVGTYTVRLKDIMLGVSGMENKYAGTDLESTFEVKNLLKGDANGDGKVTITDAVAVVNYTLGNASSNFVFEAADVNDDSKITITDAVGIVNIILNGGEATAAPALSEPEEAGQVPE